MPEHDNPAAGLWADKRIAVLQGDHGRDHRAQVVGLSKRFTVVSQYTALLAIPAEELAYYRKVLAHQKIGTNTRAVGGGGGDPYIAVKAPADAKQVVAVFPNGDVKDLTFSSVKGLWDGRFDIPFGTPAGEYRVTVIVVHADGTRTRFALLYQYLTGGPKYENLQTLRAAPGGPFRLSVSGSGHRPRRRRAAVGPAHRLGRRRCLYLGCEPARARRLAEGRDADHARPAGRGARPDGGDALIWTCGRAGLLLLALSLTGCRLSAPAPEEAAARRLRAAARARLRRPLYGGGVGPGAGDWPGWVALGRHGGRRSLLATRPSAAVALGGGGRPGRQRRSGRSAAGHGGAGGDADAAVPIGRRPGAEESSRGTHGRTARAGPGWDGHGLAGDEPGRIQAHGRRLASRLSRRSLGD